jgi:hypothetical protein
MVGNNHCTAQALFCLSRFISSTPPWAEAPAGPPWKGCLSLGSGNHGIEYVYDAAGIKTEENNRKLRKQ